MKILRNIICTAALFAFGATAAPAKSFMVDRNDWTAYVEDEDCFALTSPKKIENTAEGKRVKVNRGDILLFVIVTQEHGEAISFTGGYPFADDLPVSIQIDDETFPMIVKGEWAWPRTTEDNENMVKALKKGSKAVITAHSQRGTRTSDTFSLKGITAALDETHKNCKKPTAP